MAALPPDYDSDPGRSRAWQAPRDVHEIVAPELRGPVHEALHLRCLYHVEDPALAIAEANRVLRPGGRYYAATAARNNDPEIMWEGYPPSSFDAEEAPSIVGAVFDDIEVERWDAKFFTLETRDDVGAYCRHDFIPPERAELWRRRRSGGTAALLSPVAVVVIAIGQLGSLSTTQFVVYKMILGVLLGVSVTPVIAVLAMADSR